MVRFQYVYVVLADSSHVAELNATHSTSLSVWACRCGVDAMRLRFVRPLGSGLARATPGASTAVSRSSWGRPPRRRCPRLAALSSRDCGGASTASQAPPLRRPIPRYFGRQAGPHLKAAHGLLRKGEEKSGDDEAVVSEGRLRR